MISILLFFIIQLTQAAHELNTIYADGSIQYYSLNHCYNKFFPYEYNVTDPTTGVNTTKLIKSYVLRKTNNPNIYDEIYYDTDDCSGSNPVRIIHEKAGTDCSNKSCYYTITTGNIESDTFASMLFSPEALKKCDDGNKYVSNIYPKNINGKCVDGDLYGTKLSFKTLLKKKDNLKFIERSRYAGHGCSGKLFETVEIECGKCSFMQCEIKTYVQVSCKDAAGYLSVLFVLVLSLMLL